MARQPNSSRSAVLFSQIYPWNSDLFITTSQGVVNLSQIYPLNIVIPSFRNRIYSGNKVNPEVRHIYPWNRVIPPFRNRPLLEDIVRDRQFFLSITKSGLYIKHRLQGISTVHNAFAIKTSKLVSKTNVVILNQGLWSPSINARLKTSLTYYNTKTNLEHEVACFLASYADILWARHAFCLLRLRDEA